jgi:hypothetical protein
MTAEATTVEKNGEAPTTPRARMAPSMMTEDIIKCGFLSENTHAPEPDQCQRNKKHNKGPYGHLQCRKVFSASEKFFNIHIS